MKSSPRLARAGWVRCTAPGTPVWTALSPSKSFLITFRIEPNCVSASSAKHEPIASLNHPHICTLYDIGHQDGTDFLVMEYLEGETLAERLKKGPLPLDQVLQYAIEIADALDKAHRKGITHRDLKPGNIMLTKSGTKLLDFGLAKLKASSTASPLSQLPTANDTITAQGTILGTLQYMAPEQLEGKEADARTDIFAFGAVVYEMATGKKAFEGKSQASVIAKILESDPPPMSSLQPMTPPALDRVVKRCLAKEPEKRWQDASDLCDELKWIAEGGSQVGLSTTAVVSNRKELAGKSAAMGAASLIACAIAGLPCGFLSPPQPSLLRALRYLCLRANSWRRWIRPVVALSPDGNRLAYVATQGGIQQLYVRAMDSPEAKPVHGTEGAMSPFFLTRWPMGWIFCRGKLKKDLGQRRSGHNPLRCCQATSTFQALAGDRVTRLSLTKRMAPRSRFQTAGGTPQRMTTPVPRRTKSTIVGREFLARRESRTVRCWSQPAHAGY